MLARAAETIAARTLAPGVRAVAREKSVHIAHDGLERLECQEEPGHDGIALEVSDQLPALDREIHDLGYEDFQCPVRALFRACGGDRCFEPANWFFHGGDDDLVLGPELVIDGRLGHSDGVGDHLKRRTADAMLAEKPECGLDDSLLCRTQGCPGWVSSHG